MNSFGDSSGIYGQPLPELAQVPDNAMQFSPLLPGSAKLEECLPESLDGFVLQAPPGTSERRYVMALALRALKPGAAMIALAPKDRGGARLTLELRGFGLTPDETARRHHKICTGIRPAALTGLADALTGGECQHVAEIDRWSQPGVFSWNRIDPASALLAVHMSLLSGDGADFGCGIGFLAAKVLASPKIKSLLLIDNDRRALEAARRNLSDIRAAFRWADVRQLGPEPTGLDFVVMNPPFHDNGQEDQSLGQEFIRQAAARLRNGGTLWLTANRHLPYETILNPLFRRVRLIIEASGFKLFEAQK